MKKHLKSNNGQAMVEMVLILPLILLLIVGIAEFGFMFSNYLTLNNVSREAARYASLGGTDSAAQTRAIEVSGNLNPSLLSITFTPAENSRDRGDSVEAKATYTHNLMTPFLSTLLDEGIQLEAKTVMRVE
jgi:Flp pilus assembly protein TadG